VYAKQISAFPLLTGRAMRAFFSACQVLSFNRALFGSSLSLRCGARVVAHGSLLAHARARARGFAPAGLKHPSRTSRRAPARSRTPWRAQPFTMRVNMGKVRGDGVTVQD
jgi:hypothetical protein